MEQAWDDLGRRPAVARMIEVARTGRHPAQVLPCRGSTAEDLARRHLRVLLAPPDASRARLRLELPPREKVEPEPWTEVLVRIELARPRLRSGRFPLDASAHRLWAEARILLAEGKTYFTRADFEPAVDIARTVAALAGRFVICGDDLAEALVFRNVAPLETHAR